MDTETRTPWQLARLAGCMDPDSDVSAGACWLERVETAVADIEDEDDISESADQLVPIYTHERWKVFVDLGAYQEDVTELGADASDLEACAGIALYMIAERLLQALWQEAKDNAEEDEEVSETDERGVVEVFDTKEYKKTHPNADITECGECHRYWDDAVITGLTPAPSARCPFEYDHGNEE